MTIRRSTWPAGWVGRWWPYVVGAVLSVVLVAPFVLWENSWIESGNAYWLLRMQELHIRESGASTYFLSSTPEGVPFGGPVAMRLGVG